MKFKDIIFNGALLVTFLGTLTVIVAVVTIIVRNMS